MKRCSVLMITASLVLAACGGDDEPASPPTLDVSDTSGDTVSDDASAGDTGAGDVVPVDAALGCDQGAAGDDCSEPANDCDTVFLDCGEHGSCAMVDGEPTCQCDANFMMESDVCIPVCGDGVVVGGEVCDDGDTVAGDGCRADCAGVEVCGDGLLDEAAEETCDDGNLENGDGCDDRCALEPVEGPCGDGVLNIGEACDDGNDDPDDGCHECAVTLTDAWTCDPAIFNASDGCDCGCGQVDADCADATAASCAFCGGEGSCNPGDAVCQLIDPENNGVCQ